MQIRQAIREDSHFFEAVDRPLAPAMLVAETRAELVIGRYLEEFRS